MARHKHILFLMFLASSLIFVFSASAFDKNTTEDIIKKIENSMVLIPAGEFDMGGGSAFYEKPRHKVFLDAFYISKFEVTFEEYITFCKDTGKLSPIDPDFKYGNIVYNSTMQAPTMPVVSVTKSDADAFCRWVSKKTGRSYRLPTEAEWEKAARGGLEKMEYPWGTEPPDDGGIYRANYGPGFDHRIWKKDGHEYAAPVGSYPPNGYGLYDMAGNVWEWTQDWFDDYYYEKSPYKNPKGPLKPAVGLDAGARFVLRGGCYSSDADHLRCAKRYGLYPKGASSIIGFRIARDQ